MTEPLVYLNGQFVPYDEARVSVEDRAIQFADGVYEVVRYYGGRVFALERHLARLARSAAGIELIAPPAAEIAAAMDELVQRQGLTEATVYLQITRGATARLQGIPEGLTPTVIAIARPAASERPTPPLTAITRSDDRWARCHLKTTMLLPAMLARAAAQRAGAQDAIFVRDGFVTEASAANIFAVRRGELVTPPLSNYLLPGITREVVLDLCRAHDLPAREGLVSQEDLYRADEVFVTSTNYELRPVVTIDGRPVGNGSAGPLFTRLLALFDAATGVGAREEQVVAVPGK